MKRTRRASHSVRPEALDAEAVAVEADFARVDLDSLERVSFDLDPRLVEQIRSRPLKQVTLRVGEEQIEEAKLQAKEQGTKYQAVLRSWLAQGAGVARARRRKGRGSRG